MCYVCGRSRNKIAHTLSCRYVKMIPDKNRRYFYNRREITESGYGYCKYCAPILKFIKREKKDLDNYSRATGLSYSFDPADGSLNVISRTDTWKIIVNGRMSFIWLYHKNYFDAEEESMIPGYHFQSVRKSTILGYFEYIARHDIFRELNPLDEKKKRPKKAKNSWSVRKAQTRSRRKADRLSKIRKFEKQLRKERRNNYLDETVGLAN